MVKRANSPEAMSEQPVTEMALDGGMVRVRTPKGQPSEWRQYHAIRLNRNGIGMAWFKSSPSLLAWVTTLPIAGLLYALDDGHCGIWSLFEQMAVPGTTDEILDWFHLEENLYKVEATSEQLEMIASMLWEGRVSTAKKRLEEMNTDSAKRFSGYLGQHTGRIPNYPTIKWRACRLVLARSNRWSNKLMPDCNWRVHNGRQRVCRKF